MKNPILFAQLGWAGIKRLVATIVMFALFSNAVFAATFTVNNSGNATDSSIGDGACTAFGGGCTLKAAIVEANAFVGTDTIVGQSGTTTINPAETLTISSNIALTSTSSNRLVLDGNAGVFDAINLNSLSDGSTVKGMYIYEFAGNAINIASGADNITIGGTAATDANVLGLTTTEATTNAANNGGILSSGTNVLIQNNFISNNTGRGILLQDGAGDTRIFKNTIGLKSDGTAAGNGSNGIEVSGTVDLNNGSGVVNGLKIGGPMISSEDNIISSNGGYGIRIGTASGTITGAAVIEGNYIGINGASGVGRGNTLGGILVDSDAANLDVTIGTDGDADGTNGTEGNEIGSNGTVGMSIVEGGAVIIAGNKVGVTGGGTARGNSSTGIIIGNATMGPTTLRIGSDSGDSNEMNTIANNGAGGISILNAVTINIAGNYIGIAPNGTTSAGNTGGAPLSIASSLATTINLGMAGIGGAYSNFLDNGAGANGALLISNTANGATVKIKRALIGVDDLWGSEPNSMSGMYLTAPANYTIGTDLDGTSDSQEYNTIANNTSNGIYIGNGALTATITGNHIGCVPVGFGECTVAAGNGTTGSVGEKNGIKIASNSLTSLTIGGSDSNQRNTITSSGEHAISITDAGSAIAWTIRNNYLGWGSDGTTALGNTGSAISAADGGVLTIVDNIIGNNASSTAAVNLTGGTSLTFTGNKIGTDSTGIVVGANAGHGLVLNNSTMTSAVIGGSTAGVSNIFASATGTKNGIYIQQLASSAATVAIKGNYIGVCATTSTGAMPLSNLTTCKNTGHGIEALYGALTIGGDNSLGDAGTGAIAEGNVIVGNTLAGIKLGGSAVTSAAIYGNIIGLVRASGSASGVFNVADGNTAEGLDVNSSALATLTLGGVGSTTASSKRNVISRNGYGLYFPAMIATTGVATIKNNFFGTDWLGTTDNGNTADAIYLDPSVAGMTVNIGGTSTNEGNVISGNGGDGIDGAGSSSIMVNLYQNTIGLAYGGAARLANDASGVNLENASAVMTVGNGASTGRNILSGNGNHGLIITRGNVSVRGNFIGTDSVGTTDLGNTMNGIYIIPAANGVTVNVGGTSAGEGNVISGNTQDGVSVNGTYVTTVNLHQNIMGLAYGGAVRMANDGNGIYVGNTNATVTIGNGESTGRNVISGNTGYGMNISGGNVTARGNYFGTDENGTASNTFANGANEIYADNTGGLISALRIGGSLNRINDFTHVGVYLKNIITWNETNSYLETDNEWSSRVNAIVPYYNYWQRYVGTVLAAYGPVACYDYSDNDADGLKDYSSDPGCENVRDADESNNPTGGGVMIGIGSVGGSTSTPSSSDAASSDSGDSPDASGANTEASDNRNKAVDYSENSEDFADATGVQPEAQPIETPAFDRSVIEDQNVRRYIVREELSQAVSPVTDVITGKDHANLEILLSDRSADAVEASKPEVVLTTDQRTVADAVESVARGETLSASQTAKVERAVTTVVNQSIQQALEERAVSVRAANGREVVIDKNTKIEFTLDGRKAADLQAIADANGENKVYMTSYSSLGDSSVSAYLAMSEGAKRVDDPDNAEKIFFGGLEGLAADSLAEVKAQIKKPTLTNLPRGTEIAQKSLVYVVGPNPNEDVTVFVIDKAGSTDPNEWKIYEVGTYEVDDTGKVAVEVDFSDKMAGDMKDFELLVQNEKGEGSVQEVKVNKQVSAKMDSVMIRNGKEVSPADLTDDGGFAKNLRTSVLLAAETAKQEAQDERTVLTGYSEPGSVVFVTWESVLLSSAVIADGTGHFEVDMPKQMAKGDHTVLTYSYNKPKKTASAYSKVSFKKIF